MTCLPQDLINKIMMYNSHPLADIVRDSVDFKFRYLISENKPNETPFGRGCFNGHYKRKEVPHKLNSERDRVYALTEEEESEYWIGYEYAYRHSPYTSNH